MFEEYRGRGHRPGGSGESWQRLKEVSWREGTRGGSSTQREENGPRPGGQKEHREKTEVNPRVALKVLLLSNYYNLVPFVFAVQLLNRVRLFATLWTATHQASQSITTSRSSLRFMSTELVMLSNHLIL